MKVLGQQVFYAANPLATASFDAMTNEEISAPPAAVTRAPVPDPVRVPANLPAPTSTRSRNFFIILALLVFALFLKSRR